MDKFEKDMKSIDAMNRLLAEASRVTAEAWEGRRTATAVIHDRTTALETAAREWLTLLDTPEVCGACGQEVKRHEAEAGDGRPAGCKPAAR